MRWHKGFNPWTTEVKSTMVWVQLLDLPIEFINKEAVMGIGALMGRPVKVDRATEEGARGNFARVCVEVDLTKPLLSKYKVEGIKYLIQYEGLENICTECGKYGKSTNTCMCMIPVVEKEQEPVSMVHETPPERGGLDEQQDPVYGEWMMVKRKARRPVRRSLHGEGGNVEQERRTGAAVAGPNRFSTLSGKVNETSGRHGEMDLSQSKEEVSGEAEREVNHQNVQKTNPMHEGRGKAVGGREQVGGHVRVPQSKQNDLAGGKKGGVITKEGSKKVSSMGVEKKGQSSGVAIKERGMKEGVVGSNPQKHTDGAGNLSPLGIR
ncbi:unnamed protein product [Linum tenue]|nr:unnamed protein product [Linum tenue]